MRTNLQTLRHCLLLTALSGKRPSETLIDGFQTASHFKFRLKVKSRHQYPCSERGGIRAKKYHLYQGESIDGQTHYGENVLLTYSLLSKQVLLRQANYTIVQSS